MGRREEWTPAEGRVNPSRGKSEGENPEFERGPDRETIYLVEPYWARWCWHQVRLCLKGWHQRVGRDSQVRWGLGTLAQSLGEVVQTHFLTVFTPHPITPGSYPSESRFSRSPVSSVAKFMDFFSCNNYLWNTVPDTGDAASWHQSTLLTDLELLISLTFMFFSYFLVFSLLFRLFFCPLFKRWCS